MVLCAETPCCAALFSTYLQKEKPRKRPVYHSKPRTSTQVYPADDHSELSNAKAWERTWDGIVACEARPAWPPASEELPEALDADTHTSVSYEKTPTPRRSMEASKEQPADVYLRLQQASKAELHTLADLAGFWRGRSGKRQCIDSGPKRTNSGLKLCTLPLRSSSVGGSPCGSTQVLRVENEKLILHQRGKRFEATLNAKGQLVWSDGDVWTKEQRFTHQKTCLGNFKLLGA